MSEKLSEKLVEMLSVGNRPLRIFFFGGVLLAYIIMKVAGKLIGLDANSGGDIDLPNAVLMAVSILSGFYVSYSIMRYLENNRRRKTDKHD